MGKNMAAMNVNIAENIFMNIDTAMETKIIKIIIVMATPSLLLYLTTFNLHNYDANR